MAAAEDMPVVNLTQVTCQFLEPEGGIDQGYDVGDPTKCEEINARTAAERLAGAPVLKLAPGRYIFRIKNQGVPYGVGFWLREKDFDWRNPVDKLTKMNVLGTKIPKGSSRDFVVDLMPGEYVFSCPVNRTPDYHLVVGQK